MAFLGQEEQIREFQDRFKYLYVVLIAALLILVGRLVHLQILKGDTLRRYSEENRVKRVPLQAPRGMIYDRNRKLLVDNRPSFTLEITPQYLKESGKKKETIKKVSELIGISEKKIRRRLRKKSRQQPFIPVEIKTNLTREEVAKIETWKIDMPGVAVEPEIQRVNVHGDLATHFLGYIRRVSESEYERLRKQGKNYSKKEQIGQVGIEKQMESVLRGVDGEELVEVDALGRRVQDADSGRVLGDIRGRPAIPGKNLILTVDQDLQIAARDAMGDQAGAVVAIDPRNGEILSMLSQPSFDPTTISTAFSELLKNPQRPLRDKSIQDHYMPGSVFKVISSITALEEGVITPRTTFNCKGQIKVGRRYYHCHKKGGHGNVNVISAITQSCDIFFYRVAQKLSSVDLFAKWATKFGLGQKTGIPLSREVPGLIPTEAWKMKRFNTPWTGGESLSVAIGQSFVLSTVAQLANLYAALANGGHLYRPYFVKSIESAEGKTLREFEPELMRETYVSEKTMSLVKQGLWGVVNSPKGTARRQKIPGVDFVGKSGTAQVIRIAKDKIYQKCRNMPYKFRHHALFAGYAPLNDPVIAVAVLVEHGCGGSSAAAPVVRAVIKTYLEKYFPDLYGEKAVSARLKKSPKRVAARPKPTPTPAEAAEEAATE